MKNFLKSSFWIRFSIIAVFSLLIFAFAFRRPILIAYHRNAMVRIWQTDVGITKPTGILVAARKFLNLPLTRNDPFATAKALGHREALLELGYFTKRRFAIPPVKLGTPEYQSLCYRVAEQSDQTPIAQLDYDQPTAPTQVLGIFVYATPSEMPTWVQFITDLTGHHE